MKVAIYIEKRALTKEREEAYRRWAEEFEELEELDKEGYLIERNVKHSWIQECFFMRYFVTRIFCFSMRNIAATWRYVSEIETLWRQENANNNFFTSWESVTAIFPIA